MFSMINPYWTQLIVDKPPTLYSLLETIVNYGTDNKTKIKDLASSGRTTIFDFSYPLSSKINKEDFEKMILNNFIERRIGFETLTLFKIKLNVKLNEIMPVYNKMFDMLDGWDIFKDGEQINREVIDSRKIDNKSEQDIDGTVTNTSKTTSSTENNTETKANNIKDVRKSDTPQSQLSDIQDASYVTDYEYNTDNSSGTDKSTSSGTSEGNNKNVEDKTIKNTSNTDSQRNLKETISKTQSDKLKLYTEFIEKRQHIYSMIFKELECLFYQLV